MRQQYNHAEFYRFNRSLASTAILTALQDVATSGDEIAAAYDFLDDDEFNGRVSPPPSPDDDSSGGVYNSKINTPPNIFCRTSAASSE